MYVNQKKKGFTIVAMDTSMLEFVASVMAEIKKKPGLVLGNVIGSNIFNVFFVLGVSASVSPLTTGKIIPADIMALIVVPALLFVCAYTFKKATLDRTEAVIFILLYIGYIVWLYR